MPILQYRCPICGHQFEKLVANYKQEVLCPKCEKPVVRCYSGEVFSATGKPSKKCSGHCKDCSGCK